MKAPKWETLKSGTLRNGDWFASLYPTGWYFVKMMRTGKDGNYGGSTYGDVKIGPVKTFEDGLKAWSKLNG